MEPANDTPAEKTRKKKRHQPLDAVYVPDALLKPTTVQAVTGWSRSTLLRKVAKREFPTPVKCGVSNRYVAREVAEWLRAHQSRGAA